MSRRLIYAPEALADLEATTLWLNPSGLWTGGPAQADGAVSRDRCLVQIPCFHPSGPHPGVRELPCPGGYRALYRVTPDTNSNETAGDVLVLRVFGPGQDRRTV